MSREQVHLEDGDGLKILPKTKEFNFKCCDCGLVHRIEVGHEKDGTVLYFHRVNDDNSSLEVFMNGLVIILTDPYTPDEHRLKALERAIKGFVKEH